MFDLLAALDAQACALHELLATDAASVAVADLPELALRLHTVATRLDAAHHTAVGLVESCAALPAGPVTVNAWLSDSHHLDRTRAGRLRRNATWLAAHPLTAAAFAAAGITAAHVTAMRVVADATDTRRAAFADFEPLVLEAAAHTDARTVAQIMTAWAETVDPDTSDDNADAAYDRRTVQLSEVGDGWDLRGWLPGVLGAELAGILNAFMEHTRRTHTDDTDTADAARAESSVPVSARRADALLDLARAAATHLPTTTRNRAQVAITIGINNTHTCPTCTTSATGATGATGNVSAHTCTCTCTATGTTTQVQPPPARLSARLWAQQPRRLSLGCSPTPPPPGQSATDQATATSHAHWPAGPPATARSPASYSARTPAHSTSDAANASYRPTCAASSTSATAAASSPAATAPQAGAKPTTSFTGPPAA